jgi:hypothetical protein
LLATAWNPADALAAAAAVEQLDAVVMLTDGDRLPRETADYIDQNADEVIAIGGPAARAFPEADEIVAGNDRYETAAMLADFAFDDTPFVGVATGRNWADALAGGPHISTRGRGPLLLVSDEVPPSVVDFLRSRQDTTIAAFVYGGTAAVTDDVASQVASMLGTG